MVTRHLHVLHLLIRRSLPEGIAFLVAPHDKWAAEQGNPLLTLPTKRSVPNPLAPQLDGIPVDQFVDQVAREDLGLDDDQYVLERELEPIETDLTSPTHQVATRYTIYPVDVWIAPSVLGEVEARVAAEWVTCDAAPDHPRLSLTSRKVLVELAARHQHYSESPPKTPRKQTSAEALARLFEPPAEHASMEGLATKWLGHNRRGVRHLTAVQLGQILDSGTRAFNLRVADPYLRYQLQGMGFTWSFFTDKDPQDCHVHGAPVVEIYGILEGRLEVWWKPYYDRGSSAWNHRVLEAGDWLEVDSLQCHIVHWLTKGKGVVFKAGPGPLAEVGKLGVKGKTPCRDCPCMKPSQVVQLENPIK